jgi:hypothetical protein
MAKANQAPELDNAAVTAETVELTVDEHNAAVTAEIKKHEDAIAELRLTYKSEADRKQADLHDCLTKFPR